VVADRMSRKAIMVVTDLLRCGVVLTVLLVRLFPEAWIIYVATGVQLGLSAFFEPARTASIPNVVPKRALATANALGAVTWSAMFTLGAALGGVIADRFGWETAILLDALTYLVSAGLIARVHLPRRDRPKGKPSLYEMTGAKDVLEGLRYIVGTCGIRSLVLVKFSWGLAGGITLLLTVMGQGEYAPAGRAALGISILYTARALGTGLGPILSRRLTRSEPTRMHRILGWSFLWGGLWYLLYAVAPNLTLAALAIVIAHLGGSTIWVFSTVLLQRSVPDEFRGRVFAAELGLLTVSASLSIFVYSLLLDVAGLSPRVLAAVMGLTILLPGILWLTLIKADCVE
jgi:MFS family permease